MKFLHFVFFNLSLPLLVSFLEGAVLPHQGRILVNNEPFEGEGFFKFALVDQLGKIRWNHQNGVDYPDGNVTIRINKGFYQCKLGDVSVAGMEPLSDDLFLYDDPFKLRIWFSDGSTGFEQLGPDQPLLVAAYAITTPWGDSDQTLSIFTDELAEQATQNSTTPHTLIENLVALGSGTLSDQNFDGSISLSMLSNNLSGKFSDLENNVTNLKAYNTVQDINLSLELRDLSSKIESTSGSVLTNTLELSSIQDKVSFVETNNTILVARVTEIDATIDTLEEENINLDTSITENSRRIQDIRNKDLIQDANITKNKSDLSSLTNRVNQLDGNYSFFQSLLKDYLEPKIIGIPVFSSTQESTDITISIDVEGRQLEYQWFKNDLEITDATSVTFEITNADPLQHNGTYKVTVKNDFGEFTSAEANLIIE